MSEKPIQLTPEQKDLVAKECPASAEGTINNTIAKSMDRTWPLFTGFVLGGAAGALFTRNFLGTALGGLVGGAASRNITEDTGREEGEKLAASGVKQVDNSCIYQATQAFHNLNKAQAAADNIGKPAPIPAR